MTNKHARVKGYCLKRMSNFVLWKCVGGGRLAGYFIISQRKDKCLLHAVCCFMLAVALSVLTSAKYSIIHILILITCERQKLRRACANAHFQ